MKVSDRTVERKGCIYCEQDFKANLPALAAAYYASKMQLRVITRSADLIGLPIEIYIPEVKLAIDLVDQRSREPGSAQIWKRHLCKARGISLVEIGMDRKKDSLHLLRSVKKSFQKKSLFVSSDEDEDLILLRGVFDKLREKKV